jgi:hypothetical protein
MTRGQTPELVVDERQKRRERAFVALARAVHEGRDR